MAKFDTSLAYTIRNEGGYVLTDAAHDNGHDTFAGLTQATVTSYLGHAVTGEQMAAMSKDDVAAIYRKLYWGAVAGDLLAQQIVATCLFDMSVLMGPKAAVMLAQQATGQAADGSAGPKTQAALNSVGVAGFVVGFRGLCDAYLQRIVDKDATQAKWLPGWTKRTALMMGLNQVA